MAEHQDDVFIANPDDFDDIEEYAAKPGWIKPVGVISIVWAAIGILLGVLGAAWLFLGPQFMKAAEGNMQGGVPDVMLSIQLPLAISSAVGLLWAVLLFVCGVLLLSKPFKAKKLPKKTFGIQFQGSFFYK